MAKPIKYPDWAIDDVEEVRVIDDAPVILSNKVEPTQGFKDSGELYRENLPRPYLNYQFNLINEWIKHNDSLTEHILLPVTNETGNLTVGVDKFTFRMPYAFTLTDVRASVNTAPVGSSVIVDVNENGASIFSTEVSIDTTEKTSVTAAVPAVISDPDLAEDSEITIDISQIGSTTAGRGLKILLIGTRP